MTKPLVVYTRCRHCRQFYPWRGRCACRPAPVWRALTALGWCLVLPLGALGWYGIAVLAAALLRAVTGR